MDIQSPGSQLSAAMPQTQPRIPAGQGSSAAGEAIDAFDRQTAEMIKRKEELNGEFARLLKVQKRDNTLLSASVYGLFAVIPGAIILSLATHSLPAVLAGIGVWLGDAALMLKFAGNVGKCGGALMKEAAEYQQIQQDLQERSEMADLAHPLIDKKNDHEIELGDDFVQIDGVSLKVHKHLAFPFR